MRSPPSCRMRRSWAVESAPVSRAGHVTSLGLAVGACVAAGLAAWPAALGLWLANRALDDLDGAVARRRGATDLGGFLDFVAYGGFVVGVAMAVPDARVACSAVLSPEGRRHQVQAAVPPRGRRLLLGEPRTPAPPTPPTSARCGAGLHVGRPDFAGWAAAGRSPREERPFRSGREIQRTPGRGASGSHAVQLRSETAEERARRVGSVGLREE